MRLFWKILFEFAIWRAAANAAIAESVYERRMSKALRWRDRADAYHARAKSRR